MVRVNIEMSRRVVLDEFGYDVFKIKIWFTSDLFTDGFGDMMLRLDVRPREKSGRWFKSEPGRNVG